MKKFRHSEDSDPENCFPTFSSQKCVQVENAHEWHANLFHGVKVENTHEWHATYGIGEVLGLDAMDIRIQRGHIDHVIIVHPCVYRANKYPSRKENIRIPLFTFEYAF